MRGSFSIVSEMRDPRMYNRAMLISQAIITAVYIVSAMKYMGLTDRRLAP
jgi:hypothetical protein